MMTTKHLWYTVQVSYVFPDLIFKLQHLEADGYEIFSVSPIALTDQALVVYRKPQVGLIAA